MKILAVDTSSMIAAVAVTENDRLLGEYIINHKKTHSQKLMPMIQELLDSLELSPRDIDLYAASSGPGSFTGLRIGVTTIKALAFAAQKPVISIPTLDGLAYNLAGTEDLICPMLDARNRQVYTALYKWEGTKLLKVTEYMALSITDLVEVIRGKNQKITFLGDAVDLHHSFFLEHLGEKCSFVPGNLRLQKASSIAQAAFVKASEGVMENCFDMTPFYLRKPQAERELEKKLGI